MTHGFPATGHAQVVASWHWLILLIPFFLGLAAGGQAIYAKFGSDAPRVLRTILGWLYGLSRGVAPVITYLVWYWLQKSPGHSLSAAITCGLGTEVVLRSRLYLGERKTPGGKTEELSKGVFDVLAWYQALCLKSAGDQLAGERQAFIEALLGKETDFLQLAKRSRSNAGAWAIDEEKERLETLIDARLAEFQKMAKGIPAPELQELHREFVLELGYAAMRLVGRNSLKTLFK